MVHLRFEPGPNKGLSDKQSPPVRQTKLLYRVREPEPLRFLVSPALYRQLSCSGLRCTLHHPFSFYPTRSPSSPPLYYSILYSPILSPLSLPPHAWLSRPAMVVVDDCLSVLQQLAPSLQSSPTKSPTERCWIVALALRSKDCFPALPSLAHMSILYTFKACLLDVLPHLFVVISYLDRLENSWDLYIEIYDNFA